MSRLSAASRGLRGPFRRLVAKLAVKAKGVVLVKHASAVRCLTGQPSKRESQLVSRAARARDDELLRLRGLPRKVRPPTVVRAYNVRTGEVAVGHSSIVASECAEASAVRKLGGNAADIRFTIAKRPRSSGPPFRNIPVCAEYCEPAYGRAAFAETGTVFRSDGQGD